MTELQNEKEVLVKEMLNVHELMAGTFTKVIQNNKTPSSQSLKVIFTNNSAYMTSTQSKVS